MVCSCGARVSRIEETGAGGRATDEAGATEGYPRARVAEDEVVQRSDLVETWRGVVSW